MNLGQKISTLLLAGLLGGMAYQAHTLRQRADNIGDRISQFEVELIQDIYRTNIEQEHVQCLIHNSDRFGQYPAGIDNHCQEIYSEELKDF